jgi:hypothetical protein
VARSAMYLLSGYPYRELQHVSLRVELVGSMWRLLMSANPPHQVPVSTAPRQGRVALGTDFGAMPRRARDYARGGTSA